jgi:hypothetical protein
MRGLLRTLGVLFVVTAAPAVAGPVDFSLFAGIDTSGSVDLSSLELDSEQGYSLGIEILADLPIIDVGGGAEYGVPRGFDATAGEYSYTFIYAVARLTILGPVYVVGRFGYTDPSVDEIEGGSMGSGTGWGAGVGVSLLDFLMIELQHTELGGDVDYSATVARVIFSF